MYIAACLYASRAEIEKLADSIGYPLLIKASAGGGGRGMRLVHEAGQLVDQLEQAALIRCRVCHKPSESGVHPECQKQVLSCTRKEPREDGEAVVPTEDMHPIPKAPAEAMVEVGCGYIGEPQPEPLPDHPKPWVTRLDQTIGRNLEGNRLAQTMWGPWRCPQCGSVGTASRADQHHRT